MAKHSKKNGTSTNKENQVGVRYSDVELEKVEARAKAKGMNVAEYLRDLARRDMETTA